MSWQTEKQNMAFDNNKQERAFVIAAFGDRRVQVSRLIQNIRQYSDLPIYLLTTEDSYTGLIEEFNYAGCNNVWIEYVERIWPKGSYRADIRNSNYFKVKFAIDHPNLSLCMLDDDMYIVNQQYFDGFRIAERFGAAVPINPRTYVSYNMMGADVTHKDIDEVLKTPFFAPACNFSPFFVYVHGGWNVKEFLVQLEKELRKNVCRGTLALWKASWKSQFSPVYLPEQWCVCASNAQYLKNRKELLKGKEVEIPIMMLHLGHEKVRQVFGIKE